jgi:hypothetical protein
MSERSRERLWHILYPNKTYKPKGNLAMPDQDPNDTITRAELARELALRTATAASGGAQFPGYQSGMQLANAAVDAVIERNKRNKHEYSFGQHKDMPYFPGETITLAELSAAFVRKGFADFTTSGHVKMLWDDIKIHREGFSEGDIVTSSTGAVFSLQPSGRWKNYTDGGFIDYDKPGRPLTKIGRTT